MNAATVGHRRGRLQSLLGIALSTWSVIASGQDQREPVRLRYEAPSGCPSDARFAEEVLGRTARARLAVEAEPGRTFLARVERKGSKYVGRLRIQGSNGTSEVRQIAASRCDQATSALALFTALAIDPGASVDEHPADRPKPPDPTPSSKEQPSRDPKAPEVPDAITPRTATSSVQPLVEPPHRSWRWQYGLDVVAIFAAAPSGLYGAAVVAQAGPDDVWSPFRFRLSAGYAQSFRVREGPGLVLVQLPHAAVSLCPLEAPWGADIAFDLCWGARGGIVVARGSELDAPDLATRPWLDVNAFGVIAWTPAKSWRIELQIGALWAVTRYTLIFDYPLTEVYSPSSIGMWGGVGLRWGE